MWTSVVFQNSNRLVGIEEYIYFYWCLNNEMFKYKYNKIHIRLVNRILENIDKKNEKY